MLGKRSESMVLFCVWIDFCRVDLIWVVLVSMSLLRASLCPKAPNSRSLDTWTVEDARPDPFLLLLFISRAISKCVVVASGALVELRRKQKTNPNLSQIRRWSSTSLHLATYQLEASDRRPHS